MSLGKLYFLCGKMGSGKTTYSNTLKNDKNAIRLSEDDMLSILYPNQVNSIEDYLKYSSRMKPVVENLVSDIVLKGVSVVLDFPGNTRRQRTWFKKMIEELNCDHELLYLDVTDEVCLSQIEKRRISSPQRRHFDTPEVFEKITKYFESPDAEEGFNIVVIK